jgi:dTDP-4-amino-4,6-dideoxygalactose transaminase
LPDVRLSVVAVDSATEQLVLETLRSGQLSQGPRVAELERVFATLCDVGHAIAVSNGTVALMASVQALDLRPGDEVVTSAFTFVATLNAILASGAVARLVDIDPDTFTIDPCAIECAIGDRTRAIIPVHLYGQPADMGPILEIARRYNLAVVEDCAQSIGADYNGRRTGTLGTIGCFSFFPTKNLGAYGDAGMIVTDDEQLAARVRSLRAHGGRIKYYHEELGVNSRMDEVQAAILRVKLPHLEKWIAARRRVAERYTQAFAELGIAAPVETGNTRHVYHQYTVRFQEREAVANALRENGVQTMVYYPVPLHMQEVHRDLGYAPGAFPHSERAAREVLSLPIYPELDEQTQDRVVDAVRAALEPLAAV